MASWSDFTALANLVAKLPVTQVIGTDEITIAAAGFLRSLSGVPGQSWDQAVAFTDKAVMKSKLHAGEVPVARWAVVHSLSEVARVAEDFGWPVVLKPRRGFGGLGTMKVDSAAELEEFVAAGKFTAQVAAEDDFTPMLRASGVYDGLVAAADGFLVEQCIDVAAEYSCDIAMWRGEVRLTLTTRYLAWILEAMSRGHIHEFLTLPEDDPQALAVEALTRDAIEVMDLSTGQVHCEVFRTRDGEYVLGEIACRAGGAALPVLSEVLFGVNTIVAGVELALNREPARAHARAHDVIAAVGVPLTPGTVRRVPARAALETIPGVLRADVRVQEGDVYGGGLGSCGAAAYLFVKPEPGDQLDRRLDDVRRTAAGQFIVESELVESPAPGATQR
ncbi:ATP-grasp domain-containing protein [Nocardia sp. NPDC004260]